MKEKFFVEYNGMQVDSKQLFDAVKESWKAEGKFVKDIQTISLYFKPTESKFYAVVNGEDKGSFEI